MALTTGRRLDCLWNANKVLPRSGAPAPDLDPTRPITSIQCSRVGSNFLYAPHPYLLHRGLYKSRVIVTNQPVQSNAERYALLGKSSRTFQREMFCSCKSRISFISDKEKYNRLAPATNLSRSYSAWLDPGIHLACEPPLAVIQSLHNNGLFSQEHLLVWIIHEFAHYLQ